MAGHSFDCDAMAGAVGFRVVSTVEEIKSAIGKLSLSERGELERWLHAWEDDAWDRQVASDASRGKLDALFAEVDAEVDAAKLRDLP